MTAWVLVVCWLATASTYSCYAVDNIANQKACKELSEQIRSSHTIITRPGATCYSYQPFAQVHGLQINKEPSK